MKDAWLQDRRMQPRVQLRLGPGETPLEAVLRALGLVETLHVPPQMKRPVFGQHPRDLVDAPAGSVPQAAGRAALPPHPPCSSASNAGTAAPTSKYLSRLECRQLLTLTAAQYIPKVLLPSQGFCHGVDTLMV
jgi:hypothetical protein